LEKVQEIKNQVTKLPKMAPRQPEKKRQKMELLKRQELQRVQPGPQKTP